MPILLVKELAQALRRTPAPMVYIGNLGRELSPAAASLSLADKLDLMEQYVGKKIIDGVVVGPKVDVSGIGDRVVVQEPLKPAILNIATTAICCARRWKRRFRH